MIAMCYTGMWMQLLLSSRLQESHQWNSDHGTWSIVSYSRKQKLNTRSFTEAELVAADDIAGPMLWTANFLKAKRL